MLSQEDNNESRDVSVVILSIYLEIFLNKHRIIYTNAECESQIYVTYCQNFAQIPEKEDYREHI